MVSIIVPVFNCAAYLEQCLHSIQAQSRSDWEVLLVNDGSTDGSAAICDRFAAQDTRVRAFHQSNGGVSAARNRALKEAVGKYVLFVDADDYVAPTFVQAMLQAVHGRDVAACAYDRVRPSSSQPFVLRESGELSMRDLFEHTLCTQQIGGGCCNKIFRLDIIRSLALSFDQTIAVGEDMLFLVRYYQRCERAGYVGDILYHYRFNEASATEASFAEKKVTARTASILSAVGAMSQYIDPAVAWQRDFVAYRQARSGVRLFFQMVLSRTSDVGMMSALERLMRGSVWAYVRSEHAKSLERLVALAMAVSTRMAFRLAVAMSGLLHKRLANYRT